MNDASTLARSRHSPCHELRTVKSALQVHIHDLVNLGRRAIQERSNGRHAGDARIVHEDIDPAESCDCRLNHSLDGIPVTEVDCQQQRLCFLQSIHGFLGQLQAWLGDGQLAPLPASTWAIPKPIPVPPPVIMATFPDRLKSDPKDKLAS